MPLDAAKPKQLRLFVLNENCGTRFLNRRQSLHHVRELRHHANQY
jgi:hypothetical protein